MTQARISAFETLLSRTIALIQKKFPLDKDVQYAANQIDLSMSMSKRVTIRTLAESIRPFKDELMRKDAHFFIDLCHKDKGLEGLAAMDLGNKWGAFTPGEQAQLFNDMINLYGLAERLLQEMQG